MSNNFPFKSNSFIKLIILKGRNAENEISKLQDLHNLVYKTENSITDANSKILIIEIKK